jgi:hypothetical protein
MNNNFTGRTVSQGNGWSITHDPRGPIRHFTGDILAPPSQVRSNIVAAHNSHYTGRHRSVAGTNRYERNQKLREEREWAESEAARIRDEQEAHRRNEEPRQREHVAEVRRLELEKLCAGHPLEGAQKWVNDAANHINAMEHEKNHAEHLVRESEARVNSTRCEIDQIKEINLALY